MQLGAGCSFSQCTTAFKKIKFQISFWLAIKKDPCKCLCKIITTKIHKSIGTTTMFVQTYFAFSPRQQFSPQPNMAKKKCMFSSWFFMVFVRCFPLVLCIDATRCSSWKKEVPSKSHPYINKHIYIHICWHFLVSLSSLGHRHTDIIYCDFV